MAVTQKADPSRAGPQTETTVEARTGTLVRFRAVTQARLASGLGVGTFLIIRIAPIARILETGMQEAPTRLRILLRTRTHRTVRSRWRIPRPNSCHCLLLR